MSIRLTRGPRLLAAGAALLLSLVWPGLSQADNTVTLSIISGGTLTAGVVDGTLPPITYSNEPQRDSGVLHLIVRDRRGTSAGWSVSVYSSDFVYQGVSAIGRDLSAAGFRLTGGGAPTVISGQPRGVGGPNSNPAAGAALDIARAVIWANDGSGSGDYEQLMSVALDIPAYSQTGTYAAVLTVTVNSGP